MTAPYQAGIWPMSLESDTNVAQMASPNPNPSSSPNPNPNPKFNPNQVRGESMRIDLRADQANSALQGLLKSLYGLGFHWVVSRVNEMLREGTGLGDANTWAEGTFQC